MSNADEEVEKRSRCTPRTIENGQTIISSPSHSANHWATPIYNETQDLEYSETKKDCWTRFCERMFLCLNYQKLQRKCSQVHPVLVAEEQENGIGNGVIKRNGSVIVCDIASGGEEASPKKVQEIAVQVGDSGSSEGNGSKKEVIGSNGSNLGHGNGKLIDCVVDALSGSVPMSGGAGELKELELDEEDNDVVHGQLKEVEVVDENGDEKEEEEDEEVKIGGEVDAEEEKVTSQLNDTNNSEEINNDEVGIEEEESTLQENVVTEEIKEGITDEGNAQEENITGDDNIDEEYEMIDQDIEIELEDNDKEEISSPRTSKSGTQTEDEEKISNGDDQETGNATNGLQHEELEQTIENAEELPTHELTTEENKETEEPPNDPLEEEKMEQAITPPLGQFEDTQCQEGANLEHEIIRESVEMERPGVGAESENDEDSFAILGTSPREVPSPLPIMKLDSAATLYDADDDDDDDAEVVIICGTSTPNFHGSGTSSSFSRQLMDENRSVSVASITAPENQDDNCDEDQDHVDGGEKVENELEIEIDDDLQPIDGEVEEDDGELNDDRDIKSPVNGTASSTAKTSSLTPPVAADHEEVEKVSTPMAAAIRSAYSYKNTLHNIHATENSPSSDEATENREGNREENQEVTSELSTTSTATGTSSNSSEQNQHPLTGNSSAASIANRLNNLQNLDETQVKGLSRTLSVQTLPQINSPHERNVAEGRPKTSISLNASIPFDEIPIKTRYSSTLSLAQLTNESRTPRTFEDDRQLTLEKSLTTFDLKPRLKILEDLAKNNSISLNADLDATESFKTETTRPLQRNATELMKSPKNFLKRGERKIFPVKLPTTSHSPVKGTKYKEFGAGAVLSHFERPKEAYANCLAQLEDSNWETVMIGLKNFIRLIRHHPEYIDPHIHVMAGIMAKHVRNLRSQVSRAACQATEEFFFTHRKQLETEADDLVTTLLHRTADTNRFLRKDATKALESMCDNLTTQKVIHILSTRGVTHQNALVRTTTSYLLCRLVANMGAEKVYALNKDSRDRIFITGAQLLTEGSLETRKYAKQLFRLLSTNIKYHKVLLEAIPNKLYRNIEKTLKKV